MHTIENRRFLEMDNRLSEELRKQLPQLKEMAFDVEKTKQSFRRHKAAVTVQNLKKNNFNAYYADNIKEARELLLSLIEPESTIGCGDSHTLFALELDETLEEMECTVIPHMCALNAQAQKDTSGVYYKVGSKEDMKKILMNYLVSDVFLLGANAITVDGQIVNVDGTGNRVAGSLYGPDRIIVVAGTNKIVKDVDAARERVGFVAAPINNLKYDNDQMPCIKAGKCMNCSNDKRICNVTTIIHKMPDEADFHVILIGEDLGY